MLSSHAKSVSRAEFTLVLRTELGEAALLANGVDEMSDERILGTVAGANTLLIVCRDQAPLERKRDVKRRKIVSYLLLFSSMELVSENDATVRNKEVWQ